MFNFCLLLYKSSLWPQNVNKRLLLLLLLCTDPLQTINTHVAKLYLYQFSTHTYTY